VVEVGLFALFAEGVGGFFGGVSEIVAEGWVVEADLEGIGTVELAEVQGVGVGVGIGIGGWGVGVFDGDAGSGFLLSVVFAKGAIEGPAVVSDVLLNASGEGEQEGSEVWVSY
jgi:hypothetical protein